MEVLIEDVDTEDTVNPDTSILHIVGTVPGGQGSTLHLEKLGNNKITIFHSSKITGKYNLTITPGSYPAVLFLGKKKASFTITESVNLTDVMKRMVQPDNSSEK